MPETFSTPHFDLVEMRTIIANNRFSEETAQFLTICVDKKAIEKKSNKH